MAAKHDEKHFLRFSLIAVFLVAVLTILGIVALVTGGMPRGVSQASALGDENLAGDAIRLPGYYYGTLVVDRQSWPLRLDVAGTTLDVWSPERREHSVPLYRTGRTTLEGHWTRDGRITPITVSLTDLTATFHFTSGSVTATLRAQS